jgi:hypothetical protein
MHRATWLFAATVLTILPAMTVLSQSGNTADHSTVLRSRIRVSGGLCGMVAEHEDFNPRLLFWNVFYRSTPVDTADDFSLGMAFEPGCNVMIDKGSGNTCGTLLFPYLKAGPELRFGEHAAIAACLGLVLIAFDQHYFPLPFWGVNAFSSLPLAGPVMLEAECGFHSIVPFATVFLVYGTLGLAVRL